MYDMDRVPYFDENEANKYFFFEPSPRDKIDDSTLEGCLYYASKVETLVDK